MRWMGSIGILRMWRGNFCGGRGWSEGGDAAARVARIPGGVPVTALCRTDGAALWTGAVNGVRGSDFAKPVQRRPPTRQAAATTSRAKSRRRLEPGVSLVLAIDLAKFCFENLFLLTNANQLQWYEDQENQQIRRLLKK